MNEKCAKCGRVYTDPEEGFYWEDRNGRWRKPCKICISEYNKTPDQHRKRLANNKKYLKTEKGKKAQARSKKKRMERYYREKENAK
jgi:hypothetical protein